MKKITAPRAMTETWLITVFHKVSGTPAFQFVSTDDEDTANFMAGSALDAMADTSGTEYDYSVKRIQVGSAVEGFVNVIRAAREAAI